MPISSEDRYIEVTIALGSDPKGVIGIYDGLAILNTQADRGPNVNFFGVMGYNTETNTNVSVSYSIDGIVTGKDIGERFDIRQAVADTPSRQYMPANDWFYYKGAEQHFYEPVYLLAPVTSNDTFGLGPSSTDLFATTRWLGEYVNGKTAIYTKAFYLYEDVKVFFTDEANTVNFNALSPAQIALIDGGADIYDALKGNDDVTLPLSAKAQLTASKAWDYGQTFKGGDGDDTITGSDVGDRVAGGKDKDTIEGGAGDDTLSGNGGDDIINGGDNADTIFADDVDPIFGSENSDDPGADTVHGDGGNDILFGGAKADKLFGDADDDRILGGSGDDTIDGGIGYDTSVLRGAGSEYVLYWRDLVTWKAVGPDGSDVNSNVEAFAFLGNDKTVTVTQLYNNLVRQDDIAAIETNLAKLIARDADYATLIDSSNQLQVSIAQTLSRTELLEQTLIGQKVVNGLFAALKKITKAGVVVDLVQGTGNVVIDIYKGGDNAGLMKSLLVHYGPTLVKLFSGGRIAEIVSSLEAFAVKRFDSIEEMRKVQDDLVYLDEQAAAIIAEIDFYIDKRSAIASEIGRLTQELQDKFAIGEGMPIVRLEGQDKTTPEVAGGLPTVPSFPKTIAFTPVTNNPDPDPVDPDTPDPTTPQVVISGKTVTASVSHTLANDHVDLVLAGTSAIDGTGNALANHINGNTAANALRGLGGNDVFVGNGGGDKFLGGSGKDTVSYAKASSGVEASLIDASTNTNDAGGDRYNSVENLIGSRFDDRLFGNRGTNTLTGGNGDDLLTGLSGSDRLVGGNGNDTLDGGLGRDVLYGGAGNNSFLFDTKPVLANVDTIRGFNPFNDIILLASDVFTRLEPGQLAEEQLYIGSAAHDADDRIIYNEDNGFLWYDYDGSGRGKASLIAKLDRSLFMTTAEFEII